MSQTNYAVAPAEYLAEFEEDFGALVLQDPDADELLAQVRAHQPLTPEHAGLLAELTAIPAASWQRFEAKYREDVVRLGC